ncbi:RusA family crossover junction endodeoxyribonuclease [Flavobacterium sp. UBA7682]|uniref:RusA family crossover junction endodeoxyribonuclease n=1 Tax=Flavobacterium sp. UBA7682 TaxID=1946560 RepID=UPI0025B9DBD7|nr:RusA family crossover junction endodeoxyribonuclease [Flavobacterium sp. UBA7682]
MERKNKTFVQNPNIDYLFGMFGTKPIPTKQDKFVPADVIQINDDGTEEELKIFYTKKPDADAVLEFTNELRNVASKVFKEGKRINKPHLVEVLISISVTERRFKQVDIDNLTKCVLDALNTVAFEDDSQVSSIIANKHVHDMKVHAIMIGITKLTKERQGFGSEIKLFREKES